MENLTYRETIKIYVNQDVESYIKTLVYGFLNSLQKNATISNYFFIRYKDQDGYHLRLRLLSSVKTSELLRYLIKYDSSYDNEIRYKISGYRVEEYLPEIERYGGKEGIKIAESFFSYNSKFVAGCLRTSKDNSYNERLIQAIIANTIIINSFIHKDYINDFLEISKRLWMGFIVTDEGSGIPDIGSVFDKRFQAAKDNMLTVYDYCMSNKKSALHKRLENQCITHRKEFERCLTLVTSFDFFSKPLYGIVDSLIHMNNNRFGISNLDESYVSSLILNMFKCKWN
ncbi:thiopeptide-type bacteriocin biosynthesis protein [Sphingobacterium ginsenosidimutans]|uniref:Thiopeptide-type bacteriocin biosynthesis domain-containing protein n=1 Tax=Sphingobacterium ginsenosidimutans TaxID=687845 RepID=A0ABP7ZR35_9SPHI